VEEVSLGFFFREKESLAKKADCRAAPLSRLDRFIFFLKSFVPDIG